MITDVPLFQNVRGRHSTKHVRVDKVVMLAKTAASEGSFLPNKQENRILRPRGMFPGF